MRRGGDGIKEQVSARSTSPNQSTEHLRSTHDDGRVVVLLVVVEDLLDRDDSRVCSPPKRASFISTETTLGFQRLSPTLVSLVRLASRLLVPVKNPANERRDERDTSLSAGDSLAETEEKGEVAVDAVLLLELAGSLDTLPSGSDLDEDAVLGDSDGLVESDELVGLRTNNRCASAQCIDALCVKANDRRTFLMVASLSKERRASTSVETRPGMRARICLPNSTSCGNKQYNETEKGEEKKGQVSIGVDLSEAPSEGAGRGHSVLGKARGNISMGRRQ